MSSRTRSDFGTLGERVDGPRRPLPCHVWIDGDQPGILLEWQQRPQGWWGRCLHIIDGGGCESWISADQIRPA